VKGRFNPVANLIVLATAILAFIAWLVAGAMAAVPIAAIGIYISLSPRLLKEWERGILLRLGRFQRVLGPGINWTFPGFDRLVSTVDMRIRSTPFQAEKTLTKDTVPVNVDAVLFWVVTDARKAIVDVEHYVSTVSWAAQTTLRDVIGHTELVRMISDRTQVDHQLQEIIDAKTSDWGITVRSVEVRDVRLPGALEDAMSRKAQADREREARIILAQSELVVADEMEKAAAVYRRDPIALRIRAMNMTYESIKERGALMVVPSEMPSSMVGLAAFAPAAFEPPARAWPVLHPTGPTPDGLVVSAPHRQPAIAEVVPARIRGSADRARVTVPAVRRRWTDAHADDHRRRERADHVGRLDTRPARARLGLAKSSAPAIRRSQRRIAVG
jgi:hypothetical protein